MRVCTILFIVGALSLSAASRAVTLFADEFDQDTLNPGWQITRLPGVDMLLTVQPGKLLVRNDGGQTTVEVGNPARLSLDAPAGDFLMETQITGVYDYTSATDEQGPALFVTFRGRDTLAWIYGSDQMALDDTKAGTNEASGRIGPPAYLRIRRVSNNFIFEAKVRAEDNWVGVKQVVTDDVPVKIGLMFPRGFCCGGAYAAAFGYFHLEAPSADGPPPTLSGLGANTTSPGAVVFLAGSDFTPGSSLVLLDGRPVPAIFSTPTQGLFQIALNTPVGSHTVVVQTGAKISGQLTFATTSVEAVLAAVLGGAVKLGDVNGDGVVDLKDAVLVLRMAVGLG